MKSDVVQSPETGASNGEHGQGRVEIAIDGKPIRTRRGMHEVSELKKLGGVPNEYAFDQVVGGTIEALPDDGKVLIRGGEVFVSHPKDSASS
jgi:hypothetical protein